MRDLLSGHPQGTERIRNGLPQTWPRMQGIRAGHPHKLPAELAVPLGAHVPNTEAAIHPVRESSPHAFSCLPGPRLPRPP